jgi:ABC-type transport system involved in cytochrome bd biosynthesis fused ATPase/permease subunit
MRRDPTLRRLWRLADPDLGRLALAALLAFGALASAVGLLVVSAWLISRASQRPPILYLQVAIVAVRALGISRGVLRYAERLVAHDTALRSLTSIRLGVYRRLERLSPAGLGHYRRGDLLARLVGDVDACADLVVRVVIPTVAGLAAGALAVAIGTALLPAAGVALLALLVVSGWLAPLLTTALGQRAQQARAASSGRLSAHVVTHLSAADELLAYGTVDAAMADVSRADAELAALDRRTARAAGLGDAVSALATGLTIVACLGLGVTAVRQGQLDGVWLAALALIPLAMADVLSGLPAAALARARVAGAAARIFEVIDAPDPVPERRRTPAPPTQSSAAAEDPAKAASGSPAKGASGSPARAPGATPETKAAEPALAGGEPASGPAAEPAAAPTTNHAPETHAPNPTCELRGIAARYPGATSDALHEVDMHLPPGRRVAVVGPSGSGKSTLVAVLLRLLDHRAGTYHLDGQDIRDLAEEQVRSRVTALDQHAHLFDTTIGENIRLANRAAGPAAVRRAVERAALAEWVDALPHGLDTRVGAHGSAVSGGQAQRIALARALLADRPVVVLDEPGEHLDAATADQVTASALLATAGQSVVLVTHRMAHTGQCDEVVVLDEGRVRERGSPQGLRGWYAQAVARQGPAMGDDGDG